MNISTRSWIELFALAGVWGAIFFFTALALREVSPLTTVSIRLFFGATVLWAVVLFSGLKVPRAIGTWAIFLVMGLLNNLIPFSLITWAQTSVPSGLASIFNASTAIFAVIVASLFLADERLTARKSLGVFTAFFGVVVTVGIDSLRSFDIKSLAQLAILGAALSYAFAGVWARKRMSGIPPLVSAAGMVTCSAIVLWPIAVWFEGMPSLAYSPLTWVSLLYMGIFATAIAYMLYYRVLEGAGSGNLLLVTLLLPPIAIALGAIFLDETLPGRAYVGFGIIAIGLVIIDGRAFASLTKNPRQSG